MTTPAAPPPSHLADLLSARDSSLPLAAAALARVGDAQGRAPFAELAVAYREEFLKLRAHSRDAGLPELGALSVEEFRASLRTSVLPRLALLKIVTTRRGCRATRRRWRSPPRRGASSRPTAPAWRTGCPRSR